MSIPEPVRVLGLPARRDLTDEQVDAAWRAIAAATHPDRADGGDLARYTAASAAYAELRTPWGRSEAYADLVQQAWAPVRRPGRGRQPHRAAARHPVQPRDRPAAAASRSRSWEFPARVRRGRPLRLLLRAVIAAALSLLVLQPDPRHRRRPGRRRRPDRLVRADRPPGPGTPARTVKRQVPPAGPRAPGWTRARARASRRSRLGWGGAIPSPPARASRAHRPPPVQVVHPVGRSTWTGGVRRAPLRVADGDGMDPPATARPRPRETPRKCTCKCG